TPRVCTPDTAAEPNLRGRTDCQALWPGAGGRWGESRSRGNAADRQRRYDLPRARVNDDHAAGEVVRTITVDLGDARIDSLVARVELALLGAVGRVRPMAGPACAVEHDLPENAMGRRRDEREKRRRVGVVNESDHLVHRVVAPLVGPVHARVAGAD